MPASRARGRYVVHHPGSSPPRWIDAVPAFLPENHRWHAPAPSLWLPGFDPDVKKPQSRPPRRICSLNPRPRHCRGRHPVSACHPSGRQTDGGRSREPSSTTRQLALIDRRRQARRGPCPVAGTLHREHLAGLSGAVTKFDASLSSIRALQMLGAHLERCRAQPTATSPAGAAACPPPSTSRRRSTTAWRRQT